MDSVILYKTIIPSPIGDLVACSTESELCILTFADNPSLPRMIVNCQRALNATILEQESRLLAKASKQLQEYFLQKIDSFDLPLSPLGTPFQVEVWQFLRSTSYGAQYTYKQQAEAVNRPKAIRAVANANRLNPLAIIVPCHRVIGTNGTLTGYAGGLWRKEFLLRLEGER